VTYTNTLLMLIATWNTKR